MTFCFEPAPIPTVPVTDGTNFPVRRVFCIGKNYADHVREMGGDPANTEPVFFTKPADAVVSPSDADPFVAYPQGTEKLHYEGELVLALKSGGRDIAEGEAMDHVFGLALGSDQTRRDLQLKVREAKGPWDIAKAFDQSAVVGPITPDASLPDDFSYGLSLNGVPKQRGQLAYMIFAPARIIADLSALFELKAGDLIFTGTPEGVGPCVRGDTIEVAANGLAPLHFTLR